MNHDRNAGYPSDINIDDLVDIRDIKIDCSLPLDERKRLYFEQIKNPHCFRYGDMIVRASFEDKGLTLEDRLAQYLSSGAAESLLRSK